MTRLPLLQEWEEEETAPTTWRWPGAKLLGRPSWRRRQQSQCRQVGPPSRCLPLM